jgi:hypothetical protein
MGSAPQPSDFPVSKKTSSIDRKALHKRNLTEIEPSRKGAAVRKRPFEVFGANRLTRNVQRRDNCAVSKTNFGRACDGDDLNSSGSR